MDQLRPNIDGLPIILIHIELKKRHQRGQIEIGKF